MTASPSGNNPLMYPWEVVNFCRDNGIQVESYSPLGQGEALSHPAIDQAARRHDRSPAQVVLRWHVQHGFIAIPRSVNREHIAENIAMRSYLADDLGRPTQRRTQAA